jgi:hypothetical protein
MSFCQAFPWRSTFCRRNSTLNLLKIKFIQAFYSLIKTCIITLSFSFRTSQMPFDSDEMAKEFMLQFSGLALTVGQPLVFAFHPDKPLLSVSVKGLEAVDPNAMVSGGTVKPAKTKMGLCRGNTSIQFEKAEQSGINLTGKAKGYVKIMNFLLVLKLMSFISIVFSHVSQSSIPTGISKRWELVAWTTNLTQSSEEPLPLEYFHLRSLSSLA